MARKFYNPEPHNWAHITRQFIEQGCLEYMKVVSVEAASKCRCGRVSCPKCGFNKFLSRVRRIETKGKIKVGYLTGGIYA